MSEVLEINVAKTISEKTKKISRKNRKQIKQEKNSITKVLPICEIKRDGTIVTKVKSYFEYSVILGLTPQDLTTLSSKEIDKVTNAYWTFHKSYPHSFKEFYLNFPENNTDQQYYIQKKISKEKRPVALAFLSEELRKLRVLEDKYKTFQSFMAIYANSEEELTLRIKDFMTAGSSLFDFKRFSKEETEVFFSILNNGSPTKVTNHLLKDQDDVLDTLLRIQPQGGVDFEAVDYINFGDRFEATVDVINTPNILMNFWTAGLTQVGARVMTIDHFHDTSEDYTEVLDRTITALSSARDSAKSQGEKDRIDDELNPTRQISIDMKRQGETIKKSNFKLHFSAPTIEELDSLVNKAIKDLKGQGFEATRYLNMQKQEWQSQFVSFEAQESLFYGRVEKELPSRALGLGFAHNQTFLHDPNGFYIGTTQTGGIMYYDQFRKTLERLSYSGFISGAKGGGKSSLLKKLMLLNYIAGNNIFGFDKSGEFKALVDLLGGAFVKLGSAESMINILQVFGFKSVADVTSNKTDIIESFNTHITQTITRLSIFFNLTQNQQVIAASVLRDFYYDYFTAEQMAEITELDNQDYPLITELNEYLERRLKSNSDDTSKRDVIVEFRTAITSLIEQHYNKFVGYTNLDNIMTNQVVMFDISMIDDNTSGVFDMLFHMALTMVWSLAMRNGRKEKYAYDTGAKPFDEITRTVIIADEVHNVLNPRKIFVADIFNTMLSEDRKFFIGVLMATQLVERMLPEQTSSSEVQETLKNIFGLVQYRFFGKQSETSIPSLKKYFPTGFRENDYEEMLHYTTTPENGSKMLLNIAGGKSYTFYHELTPQELEIFQGGA